MKKKIDIREYVILIVGIFVLAIGVHYVMLPGGFILGSLAGFVIVLANFVPLVRQFFSASMLLQAEWILWQRF